MSRSRSVLVLAGGAVAAALALTPVAVSAAPATPSTPAAQPAAARADVPASTHSSVGGVDLGPNVYVFSPDMAQSEIQATVDAVADQQLTNQFGEQRYALLFEPGTYGSAADPLNFQVGYYTDVAGLGRDPGDVTINGSINVYNQCDAGSCIALNNFWRSLSNLRIAVTDPQGAGCHAGEFWATSQAASMRRVQVDGAFSLMDYCTGPAYASGGFVADSAFSASVVNGSQQQFVVRNSKLGGWSNGVWNQVFVGTVGAPAETFGPGTNNYTTVERTPLQKEEPYLYVDDAGAARVFVPSAAIGTRGTSWASGSTAGRSLPLSDFYVATPASTPERINRALTNGRDLLLTPGVYRLPSTVFVNRPDTVVLGLGLPTLRPTAGNVAMQVAGVPGVDVAGVVFDAGNRRSRTLLQLNKSSSTDAKRPTALHDVYLRVAGPYPGSVDTALTVNTSNVVLDNIWSWRADHGAGVGWDVNKATTGLRVRGAGVTAYGLFVEHYQGDQVIWDGARGKVYMFQNEMPYDPPTQAAWTTSPTRLGHAALRVSTLAKGFRGYGLGSYSFFNQGVDIHATQAFTVAPGIDARVHDVLTVFLDGSGGIDHVVNGLGGPVTSANSGTPSTVADLAP